MKRSDRPRGLLVFLIAATVFMLIVDLVLLMGVVAPQDKRPAAGLPVMESSAFTHSEIADFEFNLPEAVNKPNKMTGWKALSVPGEAPLEKHTVRQPPTDAGAVAAPEAVAGPSVAAEEKPAEPKPKIGPLPKVEPPLRKEGAPAKIVIIIDDMGMDRKRSQRAVDLPGPLTLAFLPYAPKLQGMTDEARRKGHELIIHMPMEPMDKHMNPGPVALRAGMGEAELNAMLEKAFASFSGYEGMNNHMGSRLTKDADAMRVVMAALKKRGLFFVDSKTVGTSVASGMAARAGIPHADRDVFLDHQDTPEFVRAALRQTERVAMKKGYAIAIGHPKDSTLNALRDWLPTLKERGFELVPVSAVLSRSAGLKAEVKEEDVSGRTSSPFYFGPPQPQAPPPVSQPLPY